MADGFDRYDREVLACCHTSRGRQLRGEEQRSVRSTYPALLISLCAALGAYGCGHKPPAGPPKPVPAATAPAEQRQEVSYSHGRIFTVENDLSLVGTIVADKSLHVPSRATGQIQEVLVVEGDRVSAGQVLATVDTVQSQLAVKQAQAALSQELAVLGISSPNERLRDKNQVPGVIKARAMMENAEQVYQRYQGLHKEQLVSDVDLSNQRATFIAAKADYQAALEAVDQSLASVEAARLGVQVAEQRVTEAVITAPAEGIVDSVTTAPGAYVSAGADTGIVLLKVRPLFVSIEVPQEQLSEFSVGESVSFATPTYPKRRLKATVSDVGGSVNAGSGALVARARITDPPGWLDPGMSAQVDVETGRTPNQKLFPQAAVLTQAGKSSVFLVSKRSGETATVSRRSVQLGETVQDWVVIKAGAVKAADMVVTSDLLALKDGDQVQLGQALAIAPPEAINGP